MDNTQKKKKKINIPLLLMTIGFISFIGYFGYEYVYKPLNSVKDGESGNKILQKVEDGTVYVYSEEEKEEFRKIAAEFREFKVKQKNLKPGDAPFALSYDELSEIYKSYGWDKDVEDDVYKEFRFLYRENISNSFDSSSEREDQEKLFFDADVVKAGNLFDEKLKLKNPELFCGFTSVPIPVFDNGLYVGETAFNFSGRGKNNDRLFKTYVKTLKNIDRDYKDNNELNEVLQQIILKNVGSIFYFNPHVDIAKQTQIGAYLMYSLDYNSTDKQNSINPLQKFLKFMPRDFTRIGSLSTDYFNDNMEMTDVDLFPQDYNYFVGKENYYIDFVPSKITKYGEKDYLVDIEVDKPLDQSSIGIILNIFNNRFKYVEHGRIILGEQQEGINLNLSIRITHKNISSGMLNEYGIYSVTPKGEIIGNNNVYADNIPYWNANFLNWYPNEEAQVWVKEYFELAKEAYDNDSRFSMFETMHQLADKYGVPHKTMESIVCSYYFAMIATM